MEGNDRENILKKCVGKKSESSCMTTWTTVNMNVELDKDINKKNRNMFSIVKKEKSVGYCLQLLCYQGRELRTMPYDCCCHVLTMCSFPYLLHLTLFVINIIRRLYLYELLLFVMRKNV